MPGFKKFKGFPRKSGKGTESATKTNCEQQPQGLIKQPFAGEKPQQNS